MFNTKKYYQENKEKIKSYVKEYQEKNKEKIKERRKEYQEKNKEKIKERRRERYKKNGYKTKNKIDKEYLRNYNYIKKYGIKYTDVLKLYEKQKGKCEICQKNISFEQKRVDHDHKKNIVRGLLCNGCNSVLGFSYENINILLSAIKYIKKYKIKYINK